MGEVRHVTGCVEGVPLGMAVRLDSPSASTTAGSQAGLARAVGQQDRNRRIGQLGDRVPTAVVPARSGTSPRSPSSWRGRVRAASARRPGRARPRRRTGARRPRSRHARARAATPRNASSTSARISPSAVPGRPMLSSGGSCALTLRTRSGRRAATVSTIDAPYELPTRWTGPRCRLSMIAIRSSSSVRRGAGTVPHTARVAAAVVGDHEVVGGEVGHHELPGVVVGPAAVHQDDRRGVDMVATSGSTSVSPWNSTYGMNGSTVLTMLAERFIGPTLRSSDAAAMAATCSWSVPQQPPTTHRSSIDDRPAYSSASSSMSPRSSSVAASSSAWLRREALARTPLIRAEPRRAAVERRLEVRRVGAVDHEVGRRAVGRVVDLGDRVAERLTGRQPAVGLDGERHDDRQADRGGGTGDADRPRRRRSS